MSKVIILGDLHFPFHNKKALAKVMKAIRDEKPDTVVQIGDLYDQYSFSRFTKKNIVLPEEELDLARSYAELMWYMIRRSGVKKCIQILGNHDMRLVKRAEERLPEAQELVKKTVLELYRFKGVKTIEDDRTVSKIHGVAYHHGYLSKLGDHKRNFGMSTVVGHSHTGGVVFEQRNGKIIWELNAGYLADETAEPLRYRPTTTSKWTLGYGKIEDGKPQFIPINL
jgi:predicted phosphodiesterase